MTVRQPNVALKYNFGSQSIILKAVASLAETHRGRGSSRFSALDPRRGQVYPYLQGVK